MRQVGNETMLYRSAQHCSVVWFILVWSGLAWFGLVWYGLGWSAQAWHGLIWSDPIFFGMVLLGPVCFGRVQSGQERCCTVHCGLAWSGPAPAGTSPKP